MTKINSDNSLSDNSFNSPFNANNKRDALHYIEEYLLSNGYDYTHLGLDEKELFDNYYDEFMQILEESSRVEIEGGMITLTSNNLDAIEGRIWYDFYKHHIRNFVNSKFGDIKIADNEKAKLAYHLRNIFRVKSRDFISDYELIAVLFRNKPSQLWQDTFNNYNGNPTDIIDASMRGNTYFDNLVYDALENDGASGMNEIRKNKFSYREWCLILGVDYETFEDEYLTLQLN